MNVLIRNVLLLVCLLCGFAHAAGSSSLKLSFPPCGSSFPDYSFFLWSLQIFLPEFSLMHPQSCPQLSGNFPGCAPRHSAPSLLLSSYRPPGVTYLENLQTQHLIFSILNLSSCSVVLFILSWALQDSWLDIFCLSFPFNQHYTVLLFVSFSFLHFSLPPVPSAIVVPLSFHT